MLQVSQKLQVLLNVKGDTTILGKFNPIIDSDRDIISKPPSYWRTLGVGIYIHFVKTPISNWHKTGLLKTIIFSNKPDEGPIRQEYKEFAAHLCRWEVPNDKWSGWHRYTISTSVGDIILGGDVIINGRLMFTGRKQWWMQDGDVPGHSANIISWNQGANEHRYIKLQQDGNICIEVSGQGPKCASNIGQSKEWDWIGGWGWGFVFSDVIY